MRNINIIIKCSHLNNILNKHNYNEYIMVYDYLVRSQCVVYNMLLIIQFKHIFHKLINK